MASKYMCLHCLFCAFGTILFYNTAVSFHFLYLWIMLQSATSLENKMV